MGRFFRALWGFIRDNTLTLLLFLAIAGVLVYGLNEAAASSGAEAKRIAEESIRRAVVSCYALEGSYPETYGYLRDNYGLQIDEDRIIVHYEIFASNIMPDITVIER